MQTNKRVTIKDIAREANVSIGAVYSALRHKGRISEETRRNILEIAKRLNYTKNQAASSLSRKKELRIAIVLPRKLEDFWNDVEYGMDKAEYELKDFGMKIIKYRTENFSIDEQIMHLMKIIDTGVDGIAIAPAHQMYLNEIIDKAVGNGIAVATFNTDAPGSKRIFNIQNNLLSSGKLGAELIGKLLGGVGKVMMFSAYPDLLACQLRLRGFETEMSSKYKGISLLGPFVHFDNENLQYSKMIDVLNQSEDISAVFADNANVFGIAKALKEYNLCGKIKLVGYDYSVRAEKLLEEEVVHALICQNPFRQGYLTVKMLFQYLSSGILPQDTVYFTNSRVLFRNNHSENLIGE
jgi:LacI family transcriptional regulator